MEKQSKSGRKCIRYTIVSIVFFLAFIAFGLFRIKTDDSIQIRFLYKYFDDASDNYDMEIISGAERYTVSPHLPMEDTKSGGWIDAIYSIPNSIQNIESISVRLIEQERGTAGLTSLEIYNHGMAVAKYRAADLPVLFDSDADRIIVDSVGIEYVRSNGPITLSSSKQLLSEIITSRNSNKAAYINCIIIGLALSVLLFTVLYFCDWNRVKESFKQLSAWDIVLLTVLATVFILSCIMAFGSMYHAHNDEEVSRHAIDYYLRAWNAPTTTSNWVAGTSSYKYSNTYRTAEKTFYYLVAGKIAWIAREFFHIHLYYRTLGICLLFMVIAICWLNRKDMGYLLVALLMSPQIWYLFSYTTSDHWDYFWAFIILYVVCKKTSILHDLTDKKLGKGRIVFYILLCSVLFVQMFLGKRNYLIILMIPFIELLYILIKNPLKIRLTVIYASILLLTLSMFYVGKNRYRDPGELSLSESVPVDNSNVEKDDTPWVEDIMWSAPKSQGISFSDYMWHISYQPTPVILYSSALGTYIWGSLNPPTTFYYVLTVIYLIFAAFYIKELVASKNADAFIKSAMGVIACILMFAVAIWYCYTQTYQPQGRYILPIFIILGYIFSQTGDFSRSKVYKVIMTVISAMCLYSYAVIAVIGACKNGFLIF